jgi:hypothetical protein
MKSLAPFRILPVTDKKSLARFVNLPWALHKHDSSWVPPLKKSVYDLLSSSHPFHKTSTMRLWIAIDQTERTIGRIAAIINRAHNDFHSEKTGFFGLFESIPDEKVATALLNEAESWILVEGMERIRGPVSPSTNYECGLLVEGHEDPPQIMMPWHPRHYPLLIEGAGYTKAKDLLAYRMYSSMELPEKIVQTAQFVESSCKITWRNIDMRKWAQEVETMYSIYQEAWEKNWGFVPMSKEEFLHSTNEMKLIMDTDMVIFAEVKGTPVGFIAALPDYNQVFKRIKNGKLFPFGLLKILTGRRHINRVRVILLGIKPSFRNMGLSGLLIKKIHETNKNTGRYKEGEMGWVLEDNLAMTKPIELICSSAYKRYRIYEKVLGE